MNKKKIKKYEKIKRTKKVQKKKRRAIVSRKLTLVPAPISRKQLLFIVQKTPAEHIYKRDAKGGGQWEYVTGTYMKKVLNYTFGWMWDFEIKEHGKEGNLMWALGRLTIKNKSGKPMIIKEQFGRADIKYYRDKTKGILDFGNDLKAAATDSLKKCASELGIASDVYGREEFKEIQKIDKNFIPPQEENQELKQKVEIIQVGVDIKIGELKELLKGKTDKEKIADLEKKIGIKIMDFNITGVHASRLIAELLNREVKK